MRFTPIWQALTGVIVMTTLVLGLFFMLPSSPSPSYADSHTPGDTPTIAACTIVKQAGINIQFECTDVLGNVIPAGQITVEPQVIVSEIIKTIPGPTVTATVRVRVPGPVRTQRVTIRPAPVVTTIRPPQATVTRTLPPKPRATRTVTEFPAPVTITASPSRQPTPDHDRLDDTPGLFGDRLNFGDGNTTIVEAGIGVGLALILALIALLLLHGGFILGYRSSEKADTNFMRALRDQLSRRT